MKYKDKEKLWLKALKDLSKPDDWNFKSYFVYKIVNDFFFSSTFYVSLKENAISGYLGYKPVNIDNLFWDIINEQPNKKRPLSFRVEAAFCVREINYFQYKIDIPNELNPELEISELFKTIGIQVFEKIKKVKTLTDFQSEMLKDEEANSVGIVTSLIDQREIKSALTKINEYKVNEFNSGFMFEDNKDFYDLAKEYCNNNYR